MAHGRPQTGRRLQLGGCRRVRQRSRLPRRHPGPRGGQDGPGLRHRVLGRPGVPVGAVATGAAGLPWRRGQRRHQRRGHRRLRAGRRAAVARGRRAVRVSTAGLGSRVCPLLSRFAVMAVSTGEEGGRQDNVGLVSETLKTVRRHTPDTRLRIARQFEYVE